MLIPFINCFSRNLNFQIHWNQFVSIRSLTEKKLLTASQLVGVEPMVKKDSKRQNWKWFHRKFVWNIFRKIFNRKNKSVVFRRTSSDAEKVKPYRKALVKSISYNIIHILDAYHLPNMPQNQCFWMMNIPRSICWRFFEVGQQCEYGPYCTYGPYRTVRL